jgi:hypothetical protein
MTPCTARWWIVCVCVGGGGSDLSVGAVAWPGATAEAAPHCPLQQPPTHLAQEDAVRLDNVLQAPDAEVVDADELDGRALRHKRRAGGVKRGVV